MNHELQRLPNGQYKVKSFKLEAPQILPTIESAAEILETAGVPSDEIDIAIINMTLEKHNCANFGELNGTFLSSYKVEHIHE